jgi:hypothetical protein
MQLLVSFDILHRIPSVFKPLFFQLAIYQCATCMFGVIRYVSHFVQVCYLLYSQTCL